MKSISTPNEMSALCAGLRDALPSNPVIRMNGRGGLSLASALIAADADCVAQWALQDAANWWIHGGDLAGTRQVGTWVQLEAFRREMLASHSLDNVSDFADER